MIFTCQVDIDKPIKEVIKLWDSDENLKHWQTGFKRYERVGGEPGAVGSQTKYFYAHGKNEMELLETVLVNDLPREFSGKYEHIHMTNTMKNTFESIGENKTRWTAEIEYLIFTGFLIKLFSKLFPGMMRKQTQKWLNQFKDFAEREG